MAGGKGPKQGIGGDSAFTTTSLATMGDKGSVVLKPSVNKTKWKAGTSVEVAWGIRYNVRRAAARLLAMPSPVPRQLTARI